MQTVRSLSIHTAQVQIPLGKGNLNAFKPELPVDFPEQGALDVNRSSKSAIRTRSSKSKELSPKFRKSTNGLGVFEHLIAFRRNGHEHPHHRFHVRAIGHADRMTSRMLRSPRVQLVT
jgi:hypothetical protein